LPAFVLVFCRPEKLSFAAGGGCCKELATARIHCPGGGVGGGGDWR